MANQVPVVPDVQLLMQINDFKQTNEASEPEYEDWSKDVLTELAVTSDHGDEIVCEIDNPQLPDVFMTDVVSKAADIFTVRTPPQVLERVEERKTTGQKCPRSSLKTCTPTIQSPQQPVHQLARPTTGQKCPRKRPTPLQTPQIHVCPGCQAKDQELQEARRKIAYLEQQLSGEQL